MALGIKLTPGLVWGEVKVNGVGEGVCVGSTVLVVEGFRWS